MSGTDLCWLTESYDAKIQRILALDAPLNFIFVTDAHNRIHDQGDPVAAVRSMQYILDRCPAIRFVVNGGDNGNDYSPDPAELRASQADYMNALYALSVPVYSVVGNHDDGIGNMVDHGWDTRNAILPAEMHALCMRYAPGAENYYFVDDEAAGYRYVFLNTSDIPYLTDAAGQYPLGWRIEVSNKQLVWLDNVALNTDKKVLLFSHVPVYNRAIFGSENPPKGIKPYDDLLNGPRLRHIIDSHDNIAAAFAGHVHFDNLVFDKGFVSVTTLCAMNQEWAAGCPKREKGTPTETAFDVVSIRDNVLYLTRFGAGADRCAMLLR